MTDTLLQTKLYIPAVRPSLVPRPHLVEKLNAGLDSKLTLVSAPAEPFVLILDDFHLISERPIHDTLTFLLDNLPPQCT